MKNGTQKDHDISASRLSARDPVGFPPHPRGWFSIIVIAIYKYAVKLLPSNNFTSSCKLESKIALNSKLHQVTETITI